MSAQKKNIVPFGKYKGQSIEILQADEKYAEWLAAQQWFRERFTDLFRALTASNNQADTPEHNKMQARFLDEGFRHALIGLLFDLNAVSFHTRRNHYESSVIELLRKSIPDAPPLTGSNQCFNERSAWRRKWGDLIATLDGFEAYGSIQPFSDFVEKIKNFLPDFRFPRWSETPPEIVLKSAVEFEFYGSDLLITWSWSVPAEGSADTGTALLVELKPSLGDDFPTVLREIKTHIQFAGKHKYERPRAVLIVGTYAGEGATWDQAKGIFQASGITTVFESEISSCPKREIE